MNQTIHALDLICWLMNSQPVSAFGHLARRFRKIESEDVGLAILSLHNGSLCQVEGTTATSPKSHEASFFLNGDRGSVHLGIRRGIPFFHIRNEKNRSLFFHYLIREIRSKGFSSLLSATNPHFAIYDDLHNAIINCRSPISDAKSGQLSVDTALAIYRSALENHPVHIPLDTDFSTEEMVGFFGSSD
jgi:predicted dehydrogenase